MPRAEVEKLIDMLREQRGPDGLPLTIGQITMMVTGFALPFAFPGETGETGTVHGLTEGIKVVAPITLPFGGPVYRPSTPPPPLNRLCQSAKNAVRIVACRKTTSVVKAARVKNSISSPTVSYSDGMD